MDVSIKTDTTDTWQDGQNQGLPAAGAWISPTQLKSNHWFDSSGCHMQPCLSAPPTLSTGNVAFLCLTSSFLFSASFLARLFVWRGQGQLDLWEEALWRWLVCSGTPQAWGGKFSGKCMCPLYMLHSKVLIRRDSDNCNISLCPHQKITVAGFVRFVFGRVCSTVSVAFFQTKPFLWLHKDRLCYFHLTHAGLQSVGT